jgi:hypothetical protein
VITMPASSNPLQVIEAAVKADWSKLDGDARRDAEKAVADLKADLAKVGPAAAVLRTDLEQAVGAAAPGLTEAVEAAVKRFLAAVAPTL